MRASGTALWTAVLLSILLWTTGCGSEERTPPASPDTAGTTAAAAAAVSTAPSHADPPTATDRGRSVEERLADASLAARVKQHLVETQNLAPSSFDLRVTEGGVTLEGDLPASAPWEDLVAAARDVDDVESVTNRLTVGGARVAAAQEKPSPQEEPRGATVAQATSAAGKTSAGSKEQRGSAQQRAGRRQKSVHHRVASGESLWAIAKEYRTSVLRLKKLNHISGGNLQPGQRLLIRKGSAPSGSGASSGPATAEAHPQENADAEDASSESAGSEEKAADETSSKSASSSEYHVVKSGESLWAIANQNGTTVARIKELNSLASNDLMPGDRLRVE